MEEAKKKEESSKKEAAENLKAALKAKTDAEAALKEAEK